MRMNLLAFAVAVAMTISFSDGETAHGADSAMPGLEQWGELQALTYSYGSYFGGMRDFSIIRETTDPAAPKYVFTAEGRARRERN